MVSNSATAFEQTTKSAKMLARITRRIEALRSRGEAG